MSYILSFSLSQTKCVIKFLFRQLMISLTLRFVLNQALKHWLTRRKRGEHGNTEILISREWKKLFRWNKKHFSKFLKGYHLVKNRNLVKSSGHKLFLKIWFNARKSSKSISSLLLCLLRHTRVCPKWFKIMSQLCLKNKLSYKLVFIQVVKLP